MHTPVRGAERIPEGAQSDHAGGHVGQARGERVPGLGGKAEVSGQSGLCGERRRRREHRGGLPERWIDGEVGVGAGYRQGDTPFPSITAMASNPPNSMDDPPVDHPFTKITPVPGEAPERTHGRGKELQPENGASPAPDTTHFPMKCGIEVRIDAHLSPFGLVDGLQSKIAAQDGLVDGIGGGECSRHNRRSRR